MVFFVVKHSFFRSNFYLVKTKSVSVLQDPASWPINFHPDDAGADAGAACCREAGEVSGLTGGAIKNT